MRIPFPTRKVSRAIAREQLRRLELAYPEAETALEYRDPFELLVAVILSAQSTDAGVNRATPALFAAYPNAVALAAATPEEIEPYVRSLGYFRSKSRHLVEMARRLVERHGGEVPNDREALEALPGVGRKTASVVLAVAFGREAFAVDTHVFRVARRLGISLGKTPREVEADVTKLLPPEKWRHAHHWLILHGRRVCKAPVPRCASCTVEEICPSAAIVRRTMSASRNGRSANRR